MESNAQLVFDLEQSKEAFSKVVGEYIYYTNLAKSSSGKIVAFLIEKNLHMEHNMIVLFVRNTFIECEDRYVSSMSNLELTNLEKRKICDEIVAHKRCRLLRNTKKFENLVRREYVDTIRNNPALLALHPNINSVLPPKKSNLVINAKTGSSSNSGHVESDSDTDEWYADTVPNHDDPSTEAGHDNNSDGDTNRVVNALDNPDPTVNQIVLIGYNANDEILITTLLKAGHNLVVITKQPQTAGMFAFTDAIVKGSDSEKASGSFHYYQFCLSPTMSQQTQDQLLAAITNARCIIIDYHNMPDHYMRDLNASVAILTELLIANKHVADIWDLYLLMGNNNKIYLGSTALTKTYFHEVISVNQSLLSQIVGSVDNENHTSSRNYLHITQKRIDDLHKAELNIEPKFSIIEGMWTTDNTTVKKKRKRSSKIVDSLKNPKGRRTKKRRKGNKVKKKKYNTRSNALIKVKSREIASKRRKRRRSGEKIVCCTAEDLVYIPNFKHTIHLLKDAPLRLLVTDTPYQLLPYGYIKSKIIKDLMDNSDKGSSSEVASSEVAATLDIFAYMFITGDVAETQKMVALMQSCFNTIKVMVFLSPHTATTRDRINHAGAELLGLVNGCCTGKFILGSLYFNYPGESSEFNDKKRALHILVKQEEGINDAMLQSFIAESDSAKVAPTDVALISLTTVEGAFNSVVETPKEARTALLEVLHNIYCRFHGKSSDIVLDIGCSNCVLLQELMVKLNLNGLGLELPEVVHSMIVDGTGGNGEELEFNIDSDETESNPSESYSEESDRESERESESERASESERESESESETPKSEHHEAGSVSASEHAELVVLRNRIRQVNKKAKDIQSTNLSQTEAHGLQEIIDLTNDC